MDYQTSEWLTIPEDITPLPRIDDILADCEKGKSWGKNRHDEFFFPTLIHPDNIKTNMLTCLFLGRMGHHAHGMQKSRQSTMTLTPHTQRPNRKKGHIDPTTLLFGFENARGAKQNWHVRLEALQKVPCTVHWGNPHYSNRNRFPRSPYFGAKGGIKANQYRASAIRTGPCRNRRRKHVWHSCGLVHYRLHSCQLLAEYTVVLNAITRKNVTLAFPTWKCNYQVAFDILNDW